MIDADRFTRPGPRDKRPIQLLHHQRGPAIVAAGFPDDEVTTFGFPHGQRHADLRPDDAYSSAGSVWVGSLLQTHVAPDEPSRFCAALPSS